MKVKDLLKVLLNSSEKAARIARLCRSDPYLFNLLVEEKTGPDKNERFFKDFKTLADVLIQETIKNDVGRLFPKLKENVRGEESNKFENAMGEKIIIEIKNELETFEMLLKVLDKEEKAARELANEIHKETIAKDSLIVDSNVPDEEEVDEEIAGIWIDPIDGTQEYISANDELTEYPNISKSGLKCATVLIGVYLKSTAEPIIGVINQPFAIEEVDGSFKSALFYGIALKNLKLSNIPYNYHKSRSFNEKIAITSSFETFRTKSFREVTSAGAGYKALKVIEGHADIYYLSKASTFKWDVCACQAILRALGGDIAEFIPSIKSRQVVSLKYDDNKEKCNRSGLIAFRNVEDFMKLVNEMHHFESCSNISI